MNIPVILAREPDASDAFEVHRTLLLAEAANPRLKRNPRWQLLRMDAYEDFCRAYAVQQ